MLKSILILKEIIGCEVDVNEWVGTHDPKIEVLSQSLIACTPV